MEYGNDFDFSYGVPDGPTMSSSGSDIFSVIMTVYLLVPMPSTDLHFLFSVPDGKVQWMYW